MQKIWTNEELHDTSHPLCLFLKGKYGKEISLHQIRFKLDNLTGKALQRLQDDIKEYSDNMFNNMVFQFDFPDE